MNKLSDFVSSVRDSLNDLENVEFDIKTLLDSYEDSSKDESLNYQADAVDLFDKVIWTFGEGSDWRNNEKLTITQKNLLEDIERFMKREME